MGQAKCTTSVSNVCNLRGSGGSPSDLHVVRFACGTMGSDITRARVNDPCAVCPASFFSTCVPPEWAPRVEEGVI